MAQGLTAAVSLSPGTAVAGWHVRAKRVRTSHPVRILQVFAIALMATLETAVLKPIGAVGYPAALIGMLAFAVWAISTVLGLHDAQHRRNPIRGVFCVFWIVSLVSYVSMSPALTPLQLNSANRWLMQLMVMSGIAFVAAEGLNSLEDIKRVLRALTWAAAFCGVVAGLQFWAHTDISHYLKLPGFHLNSDFIAIGVRGGLSRVSGTAAEAIELGVAAAMLMPIAIYMAIHDTERSLRARWLPVPLIGLAVPASVSRSAIVALAITMSFLIVMMPVRQRLTALAAVPVALAGVFVTAHGLIGTLVSYFGLGAADSSISHRTNTYPYVEHIVGQAPLFGHGGGTYINDISNLASEIHILDNQFLKTAIELGLVGMAALVGLFLVPLCLAFAARARSSDPDLRLLCASLAGCSLAAGVSSFLFDSFTYPMFYGLFALVAGLAGAVWRLAPRENFNAQWPPTANIDRAAGKRPALAPQTQTKGV